MFILKSIENDLKSRIIGDTNKLKGKTISSFTFNDEQICIHYTDNTFSIVKIGSGGYEYYFAAADDLEVYMLPGHIYELVELGVITDYEYDQIKEESRRAEQEKKDKRKAKETEKEYKLYIKLKEKFEDK